MAKAPKTIADCLSMSSLSEEELKRLKTKKREYQATYPEKTELDNYIYAVESFVETAVEERNKIVDKIAEKGVLSKRTIEALRKIPEPARQEKTQPPLPTAPIQNDTAEKPKAYPPPQMTPTPTADTPQTKAPIKKAEKEPGRPTVMDIETDPELSAAGREAVEKIMDRLKSVSRTAVPMAEKKVRKLAEDYVRLKQSSKNRTIDLEERIAEYNDFLKVLPIRVRGKAMAGMVKISKAKTSETREKYFVQAQQQAEKYLDEHFTRETKIKLHRLRKQPHMTKGGEIKKSKLSPEGQSMLDIINGFVFGKTQEPGKRFRINTKEDRDQALESLEQQLKKINDREELTPAQQNRVDLIEKKIEATLIFGGIKEMSLEEVEQAYTKLKEIIETGRTKWKTAEIERKKELSLMQNMMAQDITGEKEPVPETLAQKKNREDNERGFLKRSLQGLSNFDTIHQSWRYMMDKVFGRGEGRTLETKSGILTSGLVHHATNREEEIVSSLVETIQQKIVDMSGGLKGRKLMQWINQQSIDKKTYEISPKATGPEDIDLSNFEAAYWWAVNKRGEAMPEESRENFTNRLKKMGINPGFINQVETNVPSEVLELASWLSNSLGEKVWEIVNPVHEARYGASLTHTPDYTPIHAMYQRGPTDENLLQQSERRSSLQKGALHELSDTDIAIRPMNLLEVWLDHVYDMAHFAAWAIPVQQLEGLFMSPQTQGFIEQTHGKAMNKYIADYLEHFKRGQKRRKELLSFMDRVRGNFATAVLGLNPTIFLKQLSSIGAMADRIPVSDFGAGLADFFKNPKEKMKILDTSTALKARMTAGHTRDVIRAKRQTLSETLAGVKGFPDQMMFFVKMGDVAAIYTGGWPVYRYYNNLYKKQGMDSDTAHKEAIQRFEEVFKDTQQSGEIMDIGLVQQAGPIYQLFTMFMTAQTSYYRAVSAGIRNMKKAPADSMKKLALFWIVMPAMFEAIASAPLAMGDDDEDKELFWKRMARGIVLGPISGLIFAREAATALYNMAFVKDEAWMSGMGSPVVRTVEKSTDLVKEIRKGFESGEIDMGSVMNDSLEITSYMTGYPLWQGKKAVTTMAEGLEEGNPAKILGYSKYYTGGNE